MTYSDWFSLALAFLPMMVLLFGMTIALLIVYVPIWWDWLTEVLPDA